MAITQRLAFLIEAKAENAVRGLKSVERELDLLEQHAKKAGREFDRVGEAKNLGGAQGALAALSAKTGITEGALAGLGATAATVGAGIAAVFGVDAIKAASALEQQVSKTNVVFGEASKAVLKFAEGANAIGLSDRAALQAAGNFGTLFTNLGQTQRAAAGMSETLVRLGADLASFNNTSLEQALQAIQSGLAGEAEPLRKYGVFLSEATLKQRAMQEGLVTLAGEGLDPAAKAVAAYQEILGQSVVAQGDFERTADGLANQTRELTSEWEDLKASVGSGLQGPAKTVVHDGNVIIKALHDVGDAWHFVHDSGAAGFEELDKKIAESERVTDAWAAQVADAARQAEALSAAQRAATGAFVDARPRILSAAEAYLAVGSSAYEAAAGIAAAQTAATGIGLNPNVPTLLEGAGSHPPPIEVNQIVQSFADGLAAFKAGLGSATSSGISSGADDGFEDAKDPAAELADYLESQFRDRVSKLDTVFRGLSASFSFDDAVRGLDEAKQKLEDLRNEDVKGQIGKQQSLIGQLLQASLQITPEEQLSIEQAEKNLADVRARFEGLATSTTTQRAAPGSSFLGPLTVDVTSTTPVVKASLAELQVAENQLAKAKADAVGPTRELQDAEQKLKDLRDRQKELPKLLADAQRGITKAQLELVDAKRGEYEVGRQLIDQGPESVAMWASVGRQAGLTEGQIRNLTGALAGAKQAAAGFLGLEDVFGNGTRFASHTEAVDIRNFIRGINGDPFREQYAAGGFVPGPAGAPRLATVHGGELILNKSQQAGMAGNISIVVSGAGDPDAVAERVYRKFIDRMGRNGTLGFN